MKLTCPIFTLLLGTVAVCHAVVTISPTDSAPLRFAAAEIERAAKNANQPAPEVTPSVQAGAAQSYRIERDGVKVRVIGGDAAGAMYGGLDVAEAVRIGTLGAHAVGEHQPHVEFRGIKFNIPLDACTPSYSDNASAFPAMNRDLPLKSLPVAMAVSTLHDSVFAASSRSNLLLP